MELFYFIARYFMYFFIPLLVVSVSGMFSERSGVIHMALDSVMVWSCMWGVLCLQWLDGVVAGQMRLPENILLFINLKCKLQLSF